MKQLLILLGICTMVFACQEEQELTDLATESSEVEFGNTIESAGSVLLSDAEFNAVYNQGIETLKNKKTSLIKSVDLSRLRHEGGVIQVNSEEDIRPVYESIVEADEAWQATFSEEVVNMINVALGNQELTEQLGGEDATSVAIGHLLKSNGIEVYDIQSAIADKMPIQTLWSRARAESNEWLENAERNPNWDENPDRRYIGNSYERLFLNSESQISLLDTVRSYGSRFEYMSTESENAGRLQGGGCRTWWYSDEHTDNNGQPTCLWVNTYVTNLLVWKSYGVEGKGWIWSWGRWNEWGFNKLLNMGGQVIIHNQGGLADPCDPLFARTVGRGRERWDVFLSIDEVWWGPNTYLGACRNNFWGVISGRGRGTAVTMN